jgi:hypothetical protein
LRQTFDVMAQVFQRRLDIPFFFAVLQNAEQVPVPAVHQNISG